LAFRATVRGESPGVASKRPSNAKHVNGPCQGSFIPENKYGGHSFLLPQNRKILSNIVISDPANQYYVL
jgi:hypothetical protein